MPTKLHAKLCRTPTCGVSWAMSHGGAHPSPCQTAADVLNLGGSPWSRACRLNPLGSCIPDGDFIEEVHEPILRCHVNTLAFGSPELACKAAGDCGGRGCPVPVQNKNSAHCITDLLLLNLVWLNATCPSKKLTPTAVKDRRTI